MSRLSIQTRDGSNPKNKPKLYVCAHPDDHEALFPSVAKEIWTACDAALCYDSDPFSDTGDEDFFSDLQEIRLLIVIVTRRFLTEKSRAREIVMPALASRHLPILPLVRESGLDTLFAQVMGELQYLDVTARDLTALPYEEKLKRFLITMLPDGDTIDRIRQAFNSYIFLSYRKIDRKFARELIRLIHVDDACRDTAIWYDEFLTPGEDFNLEIADAIKKSSLFAMAITPNIVKDENYVIKKEYPFAREQGKHILPVELQPTDHTLLTDLFADLPVCISCNDTQGLSDALRHALTSHSRRINDPMHDYLIGLAHLNGIDVEIDSSRALSRIRAAADAGLLEALEKLVDMYWNGDAIAIDREEALRYQKLLIDARKNQRSQSGKEEDTLAYANALHRMATLLCQIRRYKAATEARP